MIKNFFKNINASKKKKMNIRSIKEMNVHYTEQELKFFIDSIKKDTESNLFIIGGWALDTIFSDLAQDVYISVNNKFYKSLYGCDRQDVADYYNKPGYKNCGFIVYVVLKNDINIISFYIKRKNDEIYSNKNQSISYDNRSSFPKKIGMNCISNNSIYLRSNGDLVCWCDAGVGKVLQQFKNNIDYANDVYLGDVYNYIRKKLYDNTMPFPDFCKKCLMLQVNTKVSFYYYKKKIINTFQIEPTIHCSLRCPNCLELSTRMNLPKPHFLEINVYEKILNDFLTCNITVHRFDFTGHGEPLMHKNIWELIRLTRKKYPKSFITMGTNCNKEFNNFFINSGLNELICAIDGVDQQSYEKYRIRGNFKKAYAFMKNFSLSRKSKNQGIYIVWKYVLFDHNCSNEDLIRAQELALEAKVDELRFINTDLGPKSARFFNRENIPVIDKKLFIKFIGYGPDLTEINKILKSAIKFLKNNDYEETAQLLLSVPALFERFFKDKDQLNSKHFKIIDSTIKTADKLPENRKKIILDKLRNFL